MSHTVSLFECDEKLLRSHGWKNMKVGIFEMKESETRKKYETGKLCNESDTGMICVCVGTIYKVYHPMRWSKGKKIIK